MAKALKIVGAVAAIAGLAIVTGGAALGLGLSLATSVAGISAGALIAGGAVLSTAGSLLSPRPKAPSVSAATTDRLQVSVELRAPRKMIFGRTAMATDLRDQEVSADQSLVDRFITVASHRINAIQEVWFDDKMAWTSAGGVQGDYAGYLTVQTVLEGSGASAINIGPRMGSSRRYTGCAYVYLRFKTTGNGKKAESPFAASIPTRVTIVGEGALVYDPRRDDTVPGGSGPQRADDQSTWAWDEGGSRNTALVMLWYLLGWRIRNPVTGAMKLAVGKGLPAARIDLASFLTAANLCDEPVARSAGGTEPRYRCDGIASEGDDASTVLDQLKATMNAVLDDVDGKIRLTVLHNDLATPIGTLTADDVIGEFSWLQTPPLTDSINVIRGAYVDPSPASLYQLVDYPEVRIDSPDGIDRPQTITLAMVQSASQAQRLVKQRLQRLQYGGTFTAVFQASAWKYQKGDVVRLTFYPLGFDAKLFRIADMAIQIDGLVPMMLREEHPEIYSWDASDAAPVTSAVPTIYDPRLWPIVQGIGEAAGTADWDGVTGTGKPDDNATNGADPNSPFGSGTVGATQAIIDASKARIDTLNNVTIPQIDQRIADADTALARANDDIASARGVADTANTNAGTALTRIGTEVTRIDQRIDSVSASGGYDDTAVYTEISTVKEASIGRDAALGTRVDKVFASINGDDPDGLRAYVNTTTQAAVDRDDAISERVDNLVAASDDGSGIDNYARSELNRIDRAYVSADTALGIRIDNVNTEFRGKDSATNARVDDVVTAYSSADTALAARSSLLEASYSTDNGLTPNGTFDTGTLGWTLSGAATWFDLPGDMSGVVRAEGASGALQGPRMAVQPGKSYRLRTRFASRGTGMRHYAGLRCFDLSGAYLGNIYINGVSGDAQGLAIVEKSAVLTGETNYGTAPVFVASAVAFPQNTRFVEPLFLLNQSLSGASGWLVCDVDYLYLENATDYVATDARITRTETAISDGRFAAATRASALEAQMAGAAGSNLLSRISNTETALTDGRFATAQRANNIETSVGQVSGRVSTVETATTDGRFAVASTVATLRSDYNGTAATVTTQAGTITGLESRTAAYWRVTSVAGNGRAQLTVAADANGGGGVDIGGNLSVSGNLIVDGTIITNKIAIGAVTNVLLAQSGSRSVPYSASYGSPSDGLGLTIPSPIGQVVRVEFTTDAQSNLGYVPPGYSTPPSLYYSLWRRQNGVETQLFTWSLASGFSAGRITLSFDTPASGSAVTYLIRYAFDAQGSAGGSAPVGKEILVATEIKR